MIVKRENQQSVENTVSEKPTCNRFLYYTIPLKQTDAYCEIEGRTRHKMTQPIQHVIYLILLIYIAFIIYIAQFTLHLLSTLPIAQSLVPSLSFQYPCHSYSHPPHKLGSEHNLRLMQSTIFFFLYFIILVYYFLLYLMVLPALVVYRYICFLSAEVANSFHRENPPSCVFTRGKPEA